MISTSPAGRQQLRALQRALVDASDPQLRRILAMVDAMPERGDADQLIAPLRSRLAGLRPHRPINLPRLLFQPLNPLIIPGPDWRRGMLALPRTALAPLGAQVAPAFAALQPAIAALSVDRPGEWPRLGATLWPAAAAMLRDARPPPDWFAATGLQDADHAVLAALAAAGLAHAPRIEELASLAAGQDIAEYECEELLEAAIAADRDGLAVVTALLAARLPSATPVLQAADAVAARQQDNEARQAANRAVDALLGAAAAADTRPAGRPATAELRRVVRLLADLEAMANPPAARRFRIETLRRQLDASSREKFSVALEAAVMRPAATLAAADDDQVAGLEAAARDLRCYEQIARRLGGATHYDQRLRAAAENLLPRPSDPPATVVDRIRLIEILQGPEAALAAIPATP